MIGLALVLGLMGWPAPEQARQAARQVVADEALQPEMPEDAEARAPSPMDLRSRPRTRRSSGSTAPPPSRGHGLGELVLWVVGGLLALGLVAVFLRERMGPAAPTTTAAARPTTPPPPPDKAIVDEADALAAAGRFAEAVHALLLRTIQALGRHMPVPRALTSREIEQRAGLPDEARAAFGDLVQAVELTRFGGRPADAEDYARCVACFERIRAALGAT